MASSSYGDQSTMCSGVQSGGGGNSTEGELRLEVQRLRRRLEELTNTTPGQGDGAPTSTDSDVAISNTTAPPEKSGYLFKWQDRSIGWGGRYQSMTATPPNH